MCIRDSRRVFGGLLAQKLVSVQPMSLPSGLIFFMDFIKEGAGRDGMGAAAPSIFGGQVKGAEILNGVELDPEARAANLQTPQFQDLVHGHSVARGECDASGVIAAATNFDLDGAVSDENAKLIEFDADLLARTDSTCTVMEATIAAEDGDVDQMIKTDLRHLVVKSGLTSTNRLVRRLSKHVGIDANGVTTIKLVFVDTAGKVGGAGTAQADAAANAKIGLEFAIGDNLADGSALGAIKGVSKWELEANNSLPEIAIKVDSTAITAVTRKLKASWSPELAQDLNAYHNLDAEVELTGILSEQIALEIDQEILADLVSGAKAGKLYWSRRPGLFVNRLTGEDATSLASPPDFTGSVSEWYETLVETINDVSADIHRKTLRGGANFLVCGPEVANILEFTSGFRASVTHDDATGSVGAVQVGSINKKWDLHVDPYFPRNAILVGRKGSSFLESGYVYAPYVPLQVTPTIFDPSDFTPRKAVMTRYGKKMVRPDMYGLVICRDLEG